MTIQTGWNSEYNQANGTLLIGDGSRPVVGTLTAGAGISVVNGAGTITITNTGGGGGVSLSPYIVGPTNADFATIGAAIAQAILDGASTTNQINIYVKPKSGGYTENLTLADGINIVGLVGDSCSSTEIGAPFLNLPTKINGNITFGNGVNTITNLEIDSGALTTFIFTGTSGNRRYGINAVLAYSAVAPLALDFQQSLTTVFVQESNINAVKIFDVDAGLSSVFLECDNSQFNTFGVTNTVGAASVFALRMRDCKFRGVVSGAAATISLVLYNSDISSTILAQPLLTASSGSISLFNSLAYTDGANIMSASTGAFGAYSSSFTPYSIGGGFNGNIEINQCSLLNSSFFAVDEIYKGSNGSIFQGTYSNRSQKVIQTTNATATTIASIPILPNEVVTLHAYIAAQDSTFTGGAGGQVDAVARRDAGVAISVGAFTNIFGEGTLATATAQTVVSGNDLLIQVVGVALTTVNWSVDYTVLHTQSDA